MVMQTGAGDGLASELYGVTGKWSKCSKESFDLKNLDAGVMAQAGAAGA